MRKDLVGKRNHVRTVPMLIWVRRQFDRWMTAATVADGRIFRAVSRRGTSWAEESPRMSFGMWFGTVPSGWNLITSHLTTSAGPAQSCAT
jgi:hypothetical protein